MKKIKEKTEQSGKIITDHRREKETAGKRHIEFFVFVFFSLIVFLFLALLFFYINVNLHKHKILNKPKTTIIAPQSDKITKPPSLFVD